MGCIYNGVCSSLVALFSWQQVTNLAAVEFHPVDMGVYQTWVCVILSEIYVSLIWSLHWAGG